MDASYHENLDIDPKKGDLNIRIGFNPSFLLKTLQAFDGDEVVVGMVSAKYPAVLREKGSKFLASVMPCILRTAAQADQDEEEAKAS